MPLTLLTTAVLAGIELTVNNVLKLDPASQKKISTLDGLILAVQCTSPALEIFIIVRGQSLQLCSYYEDDPDAAISGDASALLKLLFSQNKNQSFYSEDLEVKGNLEGLQTLQKILLGLNIDWEYHLSKFIGDIPTHTISTGMASAKSLAKETHSSLMMDIDEYIHEEKKLFPATNELESFYKGIDQLRLKVDRVEARLRLLSV